jgi:DNA-nicking Smr family endonuclease
MKNKSGAQHIPTLDLHGYLIDEVFDAIDLFLRKSETQGHLKVRIITGKGTGKVRAKSLEYLKIAQYKPQIENEGSFLIIL